MRFHSRFRVLSKEIDSGTTIAIRRAGQIKKNPNTAMPLNKEEL